MLRVLLGVTVAVAAVGTGLFVSTFDSPGGAKPIGQGFVPSWNVGDWWVVESFVLKGNPFQAEGEEPEIRVERWSHRFRVEAKEIMGQDECFRITVEPNTKLAAMEDSGFVKYVLWVRTEDCSVARYARYEAQRVPAISEWKLHHAVELAERQPVVPDRGLTPLPLDMGYLLTGQKQLRHKDERSARMVGQTAWEIQQPVEGGVRRVLYVALASRLWSGIRTQAWLKGRPWWTEWASCSSGATVGRIIYARLVDWSTKPRERVPAH